MTCIEPLVQQGVLVSPFIYCVRSVTWGSGAQFMTSSAVRVRYKNSMRKMRIEVDTSVG